MKSLILILIGAATVGALEAADRPGVIVTGGLPILPSGLEAQVTNRLTISNPIYDVSRIQPARPGISPYDVGRIQPVRPGTPAYGPGIFRPFAPLTSPYGPIGLQPLVPGAPAYNLNKIQPITPAAPAYDLRKISPK